MDLEESPPKPPTKAQDELFQLHIKNFIAKSPKHLDLLRENWQASNNTIRRWARGRKLPEKMEIRVRIMDYIWNHHCYCKCN